MTDQILSHCDIPSNSPAVAKRVLQRGEFIQTNDPLALAALILAELNRPPAVGGRTIIELASSPQGTTGGRS